MSRTQDLVLARLRLIAQRWQVGAPGHGDVQRLRRPGGWGGSDEDTVAPEGVDQPGSGRSWELTGGEPDAPEEDPLVLDLMGEDPPGPPWPVLGVWARLVGVLVVVVAIGGAAVLVTSWPRERPAAVAPEAVAPTDLFADPFPASSPSPAPSVMVHVVGEVRDPGVVELPAGSRVVDAVRAAGGLRRGGGLGGTNLARVLADGERIEVGGQEAAEAGGVRASAGGSGALLDLNTATAEQLDALPGIGPVTAAKILAWRSTHTRFSVVDELAEVPGIGPKTLADLRPLVRV